MKLQKITNYSTNLNKDLSCKEQNKLCQSTSFKARLSSQLIKKEYVTLGTMGFFASGLHNIFQNIGTGNILNQDSDGNTIFNKVNNKNELILSDSQFASINEQLKNSPEELKKLYLTPNNEGMLPAHRNLGLIKQKKMHEVLKDCPEILAQMYLTEDCYNHIPTDRISYKEDFSEFIEIISALKDQPNVISEILEYYPEGDINKAWRQDKGWYDVRTGKPLSSKQQEIIDRRQILTKS